MREREGGRERERERERERKREGCEWHLRYIEPGGVVVVACTPDAANVAIVSVTLDLRVYK